MCFYFAQDVYCTFRNNPKPYIQFPTIVSPVKLPNADVRCQTIFRLIWPTSLLSTQKALNSVLKIASFLRQISLGLLVRGQCQDNVVRNLTHM